MNVDHVVYGPGGYDPAKPNNNVISTGTDVLPDWLLNFDTISGHIDQIIPNMQQWVQNNPNGAVLTAAQTRLLIRLVIGLAKIVRTQFDDTTGT